MLVSFAGSRKDRRAHHFLVLLFFWRIESLHIKVAWGSAMESLTYLETFSCG
jgi:hypothetical protein